MNKAFKRFRFKFRRFWRKNGRKVVIVFVSFIAIFLLSMAVFPPLKNLAFTLFTVEHFRIEGVEYNDKVDLLKVLERYKGEVNWKIDRENLKHTLKSRFKWIKSVAISNFPSKTLVLYIEEEEPDVFFRDKDGFLWVIGENGEVLTRYSSKKFGYLYLPIISCEKTYIPYVVSKLKRLKTVPKGMDFLSLISEIIVKDSDSKWIIYLRGYKAKVYTDPFGQFKNISEFLQMAKRFEETFGDIDYIDLSFTNRIIVKKKGGQHGEKINSGT